jgi:hypothetical protein
MSKSVRAVVVALALVAVAAGCGDDVGKTNAYVDAVNTAQTNFAQTFDKLQAQITAQTSPKEDSATLGRFEDAIEKVVKDLEAVETPDDVKTQHAQLVAAIEGYGRTIEQARKAFSSNDPTEVLKARTQLSTDVAATSTKINQTIDAINRKLRE